MLKINKNIKKRSLIAIMLVIFTMCSSLVSAAPYNSFAVSPIIPENQINKNVTYYDLKVSSNHTQTISLQVTNSGLDDMEANVIFNNGTTGNNGTIIYDGKEKIDKSVNVPLSDLVTIQNNNVVLQPGTTGTIYLDINIKDYEFDGSLLGGIMVKANTVDEGNTNTNDDKQKESNIAIDNQVAYVVALKLTMDETKQIDPNLSLNKVSPYSFDYKTSIAANILNDKPIIMKEVNVSGTIYPQGSKEAISVVDLKNISIAPNTSFNVIYDLKNNQVKSGKYRISMKATYQGKEWKWDEEFEIGDDAKSVNDASFRSKKNTPNYLFIGLMIVGLVVLLFILILLIIKRKNKKEEIQN